MFIYDHFHLISHHAIYCFCYSTVHNYVRIHHIHAFPDKRHTFAVSAGHAAQNQTEVPFYEHISTSIIRNAGIAYASEEERLN